MWVPHGASDCMTGGSCAAGVASTLKLQTGSSSQAAFLLLTNCSVALDF